MVTLEPRPVRETTMNESAVFNAAVKLPLDQRPAFVDAACAGNPQLRADVDGLLHEHEQAGSFISRPALEAPPTDLFRPLAEGPGTQIGPYKLLQQIGEGGFGVVYMAEQQRPVRRKVALKIIKPGMDTREVIARFESERQALALMDHPNIARVLDGGTTESGRPYFVMELVKGVPLTQFCDDNKLDMRQRLALFSAVCKAIQHAHHKGVIHRDIKPTNVMVTLHDGQPVPKVIDFGVSKAISQQLTEKTMFTAYGQMIGTPAYMSPEQAEMSGLDIDTRSDVYSLGVLLYELLTGSTPLEAKSLRGKAYAELQRMIREDEPPRPSLRVSTQGEATALIAAQRGTGPRELGALLRGELDWMVMKALEKNRDRRYESANSFAADIERYLKNEAVEACPPSALYRVRKFIRRNRVACTTGTFIALSLLVGILSSTMATRDALYQRRMTEESLIVALADRQAAEQAQKNTVVALQVADRERERAEANAKAARDSEHVAQQERDTATQAQQSALQEKNNALAAKEELSHTIYALDMAQVQAAGDSRQFARVAQLLELQRPAAGKPDPRGFEWHYWQRLMKRGRLRSIEVPQLASPDRFRTRIFSRGGARLAALLENPSASTSQPGLGLLAVFDSASGRELLAPLVLFPDLPADGLRTLTLTMSDDGTRLAAATSTRLSSTDPGPSRISIRDANTGSEMRHIEIPEFVSEIALTADGSRIAVEYAEIDSEVKAPRLPRDITGFARVKIWDTSTGELVRSLPMLPWSALNSRIIWNPDGSRLLRQSVTSEIVEDKRTFRERFQVVDAASGEKLWERDDFPPHHANPRRAWSWSPDGKLVVIFELAEPGIAAKNNAQLWDSSTGKTLAILDREAPSNSALNATIDFSPDSQRLALATMANEIYVWELPELPLASEASPLHIAAPHLTLQTAGGAIQAISFSADGRELASVDAGKSIVTWDATAREETGLGPDSLEGYFLAAISADATKVAFSAGGIRNPMSCVWDLVKNQEVFRSKTVGNAFSRPGFSADGRRVALVQLPGTSEGISQIRIYDTLTGEELSAIPVDQTGPSFGSAVAGPVFRPDGGQIATLIRPPTQSSRENPPPARLIAWDAGTGRPVFSVTVNAMFAGWLVYSLDGKSLVLGTTGQPDSAAVFYDAATGERQRSIPMPSSPNTGVYIDIRHQIFSSFVGPDALFSNLATGQERLRLRGYSDINDCAVSPDGSRIAVGKPPLLTNGESEVSLWSLKSGRQLLALKRQGTIENLSFSPDGNRLVAAFQQSGPSAIKPIQIYDATPLPEKP
jgi:serine/threonine protein kinase/WD40 repeat protein